MVGLITGSLLIWIVTSKFHRRRRMDSETTITSGSITPSRSIHSAMDGLTLSESDTNIVKSVSPSNENTDLDEKVSDESSEDSEECMSESILDSLDESFETIEHYYEGLITSIKSFTDGFNLNIIVASALSPTYVYK
jgi:hypothetical protein